MAQNDLDACYRTTGLAVIESDVKTKATIKAGLLGLAAGLGDRDVAKDFRKVFDDRTFKEDEVVTKKVKNGFTLEVYFPPVPDHEGKTAEYLQRFEGKYLKVDREWPITILFKEGKPRQVIRVWQVPKYKSKTLLGLVRKALKQHFLEDDPKKLLSAASHCLKETELANAVLICDRIRSLAGDAAVKEEASAVGKQASDAFTEGAKAKQVKRYRGWEEPRRKATTVKAAKGMKLKRVNDFVTYEYPDEAGWQDLQEYAVAGKLKEGLLIIYTGSFHAQPPPEVVPTITFNGKRFNISNISKFAKELQRSWKEDFTTVFKATKPTKYRVKKGKSFGFDMLVRGGKTKGGTSLLERFTGQASTVDASRPWSPQDVKMEFRQLVIGGKSGTLIMYLLSTEGFFKTYSKETKRIISSFRVE